MGQNLYDPPDVSGWDLGQSWFSTGSMLARMNFASQLAGNQKFNLATAAKPHASYARRAAGLRARFAEDAAARRDRHRANCPTTCVPPARGPEARRRSRTRSPASCTWSPARRSISSYEGHPTPIHPGRRRRLHGHLRRAGVSERSRAGAGRRVSRNLVVLYLSGGNDSLSMLVPYNDPFYYSRRPNIGVPAANVLQIGTDSSKVALGLHPRLTGLKQIFDQGRLAIIQRTGYPNQSRSHFQGTDIWSTADPANSHGSRLGRPLPRFAAVAARSAGRLEHDARSAARAAVEPRRGAGDSQSGDLCVLESECAAPRRPPNATRRCGSTRTCRSISRRWPLSTAARRLRWRRSIASQRSRPTTARRPIRLTTASRRR